MRSRAARLVYRSERRGDTVDGERRGQRPETRQTEIRAIGRCGVSKEALDKVKSVRRRFGLLTRDYGTGTASQLAAGQLGR